MNIPIDETKNINTEPIYQFQIKEKTDKCYFMHIGNMTKITDILVKSFDYKHVKCNLVSCLFDTSEIKQLQTNKIYPLIRLDYYSKKNMKLLGNISCNVNITTDITKMISTKDKKIPLTCNFIIIYHNDTINKCLEKLNINPSINEMFDKCVYKMIEILEG